MECCQATGWQHQVGSHDRWINQSPVRPKSLYKQLWAWARGLWFVVCVKVRTLSTDSHNRPDPRVDPRATLRSCPLMDCVRLSGSLPERWAPCVHGL